MIERDRPGLSRVLELLVGIALMLWLALGWPGDGQAQTPANNKARPDDLLKSAPFDRITLTDNSVFEIEPIQPRPLPPLDKKRPRSVTEIEDLPEKTKSRRKDAFEKKDEEADQQVIIHMMEGEPRDFKLKRGSIKDVEYFEDMLLVEADRLTKAGEFARAFERLQVVKTRDPGWRGLDDRVNKLLFDEGAAALGEDNARGLRLLTDLRSRKPDYPGLGDRLASTFARQIERALAANDYVAGRRLIREVEALTSRNPEARAAREEYVGRARSLMTRAAGASPDDRVDLLAEAAKIWTPSRPRRP
jgi:peptide/nickel transport system substrate-binding protein